MSPTVDVKGSIGYCPEYLLVENVIFSNSSHLFVYNGAKGPLLFSQNYRTDLSRGRNLY